MAIGNIAFPKSTSNGYTYQPSAGVEFRLGWWTSNYNGSSRWGLYDGSTQYNFLESSGDAMMAGAMTGNRGVDSGAAMNSITGIIFIDNDVYLRLDGANGNGAIASIIQTAE